MRAVLLWGKGHHERTEKGYGTLTWQEDFTDETAIGPKNVNDIAEFL